MAKFDFLTDEDTSDLLLSPTGEISFTSTIQESLAQRLGIRLKTWQGTWGYNLEFGTPYRQRILFDGNTKEELDAIFIGIINEEEDVLGIQDMKSFIDPSSRIYTIEHVAVLTSKGVLNIPLVNPNMTTNSYPEPLTFDYFKGCSLTPQDIEASDRLYKLMNYQLGLPNGDPSVGDYTWYNLWSKIIIQKDDLLIRDTSTN